MHKDTDRDDDIAPTWVVANVNLCMEQESEANARLIASAPELLAALQECSDLLEQWWEENGSPVHATEPALWNAWRAIAKATGEESHDKLGEDLHNNGVCNPKECAWCAAIAKAETNS